ncbi:MAG: hypothetical protein CSA65_04325 [Proteobacteria bacterium]|nr:MAG: hypothetical protein CSA65_04325 [Pseudomonadota bacterium]
MKRFPFALLLTLTLGAHSADGAPKRGPRLKLSWVKLPAGSFTMGSKRKGEGPIRHVKVGAFAMLKSEVTLAQYRACVRAKVCKKASLGDPDLMSAPWYNWGSGRAKTHPVNGVEWADAKTFCRWIGARLPSEAEWEYAARSGGKPKLYPWGARAPSCKLAVMETCKKDSTAPVCSRAAGNTEQGLCDMAGNVAEWVADCAEVQKTYKTYVIRGGGWEDSADALRTTKRDDSITGTYNIGFRCAK